MYDDKNKKVICSKSFASPYPKILSSRGIYWGQVFSRKLLRVFNTITNQDIENEAAAIDRLLPHPYLVIIHNKGWLNNTGLYAIDMELCQYDLSVYIAVDGLRLIRALQRANLLDVLNQLSNSII